MKGSYTLRRGTVAVLSEQEGRGERLEAQRRPRRCAPRADFCTLRGMNLSAFALVVAAACLHALWNLAAKRVSGNVGVLWLGLCLAGVALSSALLSFDLAGLPYLLAQAGISQASAVPCEAVSGRRPDV